MACAWEKAIQKFLRKEFDIKMNLEEPGCVELSGITLTEDHGQWQALL
jgi:hypothetical protein